MTWKAADGGQTADSGSGGDAADNGDRRACSNAGRGSCSGRTRGAGGRCYATRHGGCAYFLGYGAASALGDTFELGHLD